MMFNKNEQNQEARDYANQFQAGRDVNIYNNVYNNGISEKRACEIFDARIPEAIKQCSDEAKKISRKRINNFGRKLLPKLVKERVIESLKDPDIQFLLIDAQRTAASTERDSDYALLSELIVHRIKKGNDRYIAAGINRAVKIVHEISDEALLGLTISYAVLNLIPLRGEIHEGLSIINNMFSGIMYDELPKGNLWIKHLDVLNAARIEPFAKLLVLEKVYEKSLSGYFDNGIEKTSDNYAQAVSIIKEASLPESIFCDHELQKGFVRLKVPNISNPDTLNLSSEEDKSALEKIYSLYNKDSDLRQNNVKEFFRLWDGFEKLRLLRLWWDNISPAFMITPIGEVLAHANAEKYYSGLPEFC